MSKQPECRHCGSTNGIWSSFSPQGKKRWKCKDCGMRLIMERIVKEHANSMAELPQPAELDTSGYVAEVLQYLRKRGPKRLVITCAQNATPVHKVFKSLLTYCKRNDAKLIIIPLRYHNPTSQWTKKDEKQDWWTVEVVKYMVEQRVNINKNLTLLADVKMQPTATRPLSNFETISGDKSAIFGHPKLELLSISTPQNKLPKLLTTSACVTKRNYIPGKAGKRAEFHHTFGAILVELDDQNFYLRQLNAKEDGSFMDLNVEYDGTKIKKFKHASALVMGDTHFEFMHPDVLAGTFKRKDSIVNTLKPQKIVWHDSVDAYAISHHHRDNPFIRYAKHQAGRNNIEAVLDNFFNFVTEVTPDYAENIFVASNHPEHIARWIREADPKHDPVNALFWAKSYVAMLEGTKSTPSGTFVPDPFDYWARKKLSIYSRCRFLRRDEGMLVNNIEIGYHGDRGPNGSRGSIGTYRRIGVKTIIGHHHNPAILEGTYCTGTSSYLNMDYTSGQPSAWLWAHCIVYPNGKRSLITILPEGEWKL